MDKNKLILDANSICDALDGIDYLLDHLTLPDDIDILSSLFRSVRCLAVQHSKELDNIKVSEVATHG